MVFGNKYFQHTFKLLHKISLKGLNYGRGTNFNKSGELFVLRYVKNKFKNIEQLTIFDVGGNVGNYAKELSKIFNSQSVIHAFEPSKYTFKEFLKTTKKYSNIIANNFGLGDKEHLEFLYTNEDGSGLASIYKRELDHFGIEMDQKEEINLTTIDIYCAQNNVDKIHFLKLDIEGHELSALLGANRMLENKKIEVIQFEFGGCNIDSRTYFRDFYNLLNKDFKLYRILSNGIIELKSYKETYEIFTTVNYLAVLK